MRFELLISGESVSPLDWVKELELNDAERFEEEADNEEEEEAIEVDVEEDEDDDDDELDDDLLEFLSCSVVAVMSSSWLATGIHVHIMISLISFFRGAFIDYICKDFEFVMYKHIYYTDLIELK